MPEERFDLLDPITGQLTGESELRSVVHAKGLYHSCIHLWVFDVKQLPDNNDTTPTPYILLQRRSKVKESFPYAWDISSAGHLSSGENQLICLVRELWEELGIIVQFNVEAYIKMCDVTNDGNDNNNVKDYNAISIQMKHDAEQQLYPIPLDDINNNTNNTTSNDLYKCDPPLLREACIAAQCIYNDMTIFQHHNITPNIPLNVQYPVVITTIANPNYKNNTTLYFTGKYLQQSVVNADNYIDNEFAYVFFLRDDFYTSSQIDEFFYNNTKNNQIIQEHNNNGNQISPIPVITQEDVENKINGDDDTNITDITDNNTNDTGSTTPDEANSNTTSHHIVQFLDSEVASVAYVPLRKYVDMQYELYTASNGQSLSPLTSPNDVATPSSTPGTLGYDNTKLDPSRPTYGDIDVYDPSWLVPITKLDEYAAIVFDRIFELTNYECNPNTNINDTNNNNNDQDDNSSP